MSEQAVFRAISHPARREIIRLLTSEQMSVGDVALRFEMTRPAVAKHLEILREAGLIKTHREGRETFNQLIPLSLKPVADWLEFYSQFWDEKLHILKGLVEEEDSD